MAIYSLSELRTLALHTQQLTIPSGQGPGSTSDNIYQVVESLGCVQIDTLQMVQRSHYLVMWSRLGCYDPVGFDRLIYNPQYRRLFEGWQHAASIIPLIDYRYQMPHQRQLREGPHPWFQNWKEQPGNIELMQIVLERIRQEGALKGADFEYHGPKRGSWWDWKPAKTALEFRYAYGDLMITSRANFQRVYDLTERVLPAWVDTKEPTLDERNRHWIEQGVRASGVCQPAQAGDYCWMKRGNIKPYVEALIREGTFVQIEADLTTQKQATLIIHKDNLPLLEQCADRAILPERTTFLSPFDNLFWVRGRDEQLWGFRNVLEAYKPAPKRTWGYFCLPILHGERLVGRFDPKLERQNNTLRLKSLYLEEGVEPDEELVLSSAAAMRDFLAFHKAKDLVIDRSQPAVFGDKLLKML